MTATFETFMTLCERVREPNRSALTPVWEDGGRRLYSHPTANTLVAECGRGSIKSGFGSRVALNEVLCGDFSIPAGEIHYWIDVSENMAEARQRLRQYEEWLTICGIPFERRADELILPELRRGFLVRAAAVGRLSGFRSIGFRVDEGAKLTSDDASANPLAEIWASGTAMLVTHLENRPKRLLLSSPMALVGFFNDMARRGDTDDQVFVHAETWVANPSITEAQTRALEPDPRIWAREYAAIASAAVDGAFPDSEANAAAFRVAPDGYTEAAPIAVIDWSSGKSDSATIGVMGMLLPPRALTIASKRKFVPVRGHRDGGVWIDEPVLDDRGQRIPLASPPPRLPPLVRFHEVTGVDGAFWKGLPADQLADRFAGVAKRWGCTLVVGDSYSDYGIAPHFARHGLAFQGIPWTAKSKAPAVHDVRALLRERRLILPEHERLRREIATYEERVTPSGAVTYSAHGRGHDDYVALLVTGAMALSLGLVPASPRAAPRRPKSVNLPDYSEPKDGRDENDETRPRFELPRGFPEFKL